MTENSNTAQSLLATARGYAKKKQNKKAFKAYIQALQIEPFLWEAYFDLGGLLLQSDKHHAALVCFQRATNINSKHVELWTRLGNVLRLNNRFKEALRAFKKGLRIDPEYILLNYNMGLLYKDMNKPDLATEFFNKVINSESDDSLLPELVVESQWLRALCALQTGDYESGWPGFESRLALTRIPQPKFSGLPWKGESLQDKTIFLTYEQRFGDVIHIIRFIPYLSKQGARVIVQSPKQLTRLLQQVEGVDKVVDVDAELPAYDYYLPITSIPVVLNIPFEKIPAVTPYIKVADMDGPAIPEFTGMKLKVGMIWAGKPKPDRSCPLSCLIPLLKRQEVGFYSFQLGPRRKDIFENNVGWMLHDLSPRIDDFYTSTQLMQQMDLIITIDSAPAHLGAALGKPVWMLLLYSTDWRWMLDRDDTPWYPTMRLFRQEKPGCWDGPALKLEKAFDNWVDVQLER